MPRLQILVVESDRFSAGAQAILREIGDLTLANLDRAGLLRGLRDVDVLWVRLRHRIDVEVLDCAPRLRYLLSATTGLNHLDLPVLEQRDVRVISLRGETSFLRDIRATAEHTLALMLALLRQLPRACASVAEGRWDRDQFWGRELYGKTVGIVGYGRLGRLVGDYLLAFGARVLATDPAAGAQVVSRGVELVPIDVLLSASDIVTLHVQLDEHTRQFFSRSHFARMKPGAWLVNTARGELVEEAGLLEALRNGRLAGAALDVLSEESSAGMDSHPLVQFARSHSQLLITPHIGGCTFESVEKTEVFLAEKLRSSVRADTLIP